MGQQYSISRAQIAKIYATAAELGIDNDLLHELVRAETSKESLRQLTMQQAVHIIDRLTGHQTAKGMATQNQKRYIDALLKQLKWVLPDGTIDLTRLDGLLRPRFGIDSYKWLTIKAASDLIECLKQMLIRKK